MVLHFQNKQKSCRGLGGLIAGWETFGGAGGAVRPNVIGRFL